MNEKKCYNNWSTLGNIRGSKMVNRAYKKLLSVILLTIFVSVLLGLLPAQEVVAVTCPPEICFESDNYTFEDGGPTGIPVIVTVNDETKKDSGKVEVSITSSVDPIGTKLTLNEISPGIFKNTNLIFMEQDALFSVDDTGTMTLNRVSFPGGCNPGNPPDIPAFGNCDPETIETIGGPTPALVISSSNPSEKLTPVFTETAKDSGIFTATIRFSTTTFEASTNTLLVQEGDIISFIDFEKGFTSNGMIIPNPDSSVGAILAELDGSVFATYNPTDEINIKLGSGPGTGGGGAIRPSLVVDSKSDRSSGSTQHEPPTIGRSLDGTIQHIGDGGISIDGKKFLVTKPFHQEFELYEMLSGKHTISNIIYCPRGVQACNYIAIGVTPYAGDVDDAIWWIELRKDIFDNWEITVFDNTGKIGTPLTFTTQVIDNYRLGTSITIPFNNIDTPPLKLWVQVRDDKNGIRNFYFNEGVQFKDAHSYPYIETTFEAPLKVEPLCLDENPNHRYSCAFDKIKEWTIQNAENTLNQLMGNNKVY